MDRRSWPWKKRSSLEKSTTHVAVVDAPNDETTPENQLQNNNPTKNNAVDYVQLPQERYMQLSEMEDQVKTLTEQLSCAQAELTTKDALIKQHTKVAEEAVSGWEKAEAEAFSLKNNLESVTVLELAAEDRAIHLDNALKDCMEEMRIGKEESEQKLHDVVFANTQHWEKLNLELEVRVNVLEEQLLRANAENDALSRSLQDRSGLLMELSEDRAQAQSQIEVLKTKFHASEKELTSVKYELNVVSKEVEIRTEEKNMSVRSAQVANKQHLEDVKKMTKLEAECQRLRGLVRKKLPGPAALAQMKLVDADYGETRSKRERNSSSSPVKLQVPQDSPVPAAPHENIDIQLQQCQKENEFLTTRMVAAEEEMKMLKEALSKRNTELLESRNMHAKTTSKLRDFENTMNNSRRSRHSSHQTSPSTSMSEDAGNSNRMDLLMDDFLEMEKLACLSTTVKINLSCSEKVLKAAISQIHDFVMSFVKSSDGDGINVDELSAVANRLVLSGELCVDEFLVTLSDVLSHIDRIGLGIFCNKNFGVNSSPPDCIDKVTLLENKVVHHYLESPQSDGRALREQRSGPDEETGRCLPESEQLKLDKANLAVDLAKCTEIIEQSKSQLHDTQKDVEDLKSQFSACQKSKSLADTQLKCMVESYRSLELRSRELETEITHLQSKCEALDIELKEEKCAHREDLAKFKDLVGMCRKNDAEGGEVKTKQEMEIEAAAEKLAECQHTIFLLDKQFKSTNPSNSNNHLVFSDDVVSTTSCSTPRERSPILKPPSFSPNLHNSSRSPLSSSVEEKPGRSFGQLFSKTTK
ncbi:hypothetical protein ZOSMA_34G00350 [Zostera marina]|uniref:Filament-like plant protein 4 n=1 Tax=Zostera marina TaxID=29655 RepID=A0A0K9P6X7_ZOSMR|nr:hypothetical protein ZOSMA_34G00350 [Zostera marina]